MQRLRFPRWRFLSKNATTKDFGDYNVPEILYPLEQASSALYEILAADLITCFRGINEEDHALN